MRVRIRDKVPGFLIVPVGIELHLKLSELGWADDLKRRVLEVCKTSNGGGKAPLGGRSHQAAPRVLNCHLDSR